MDVIAQLQREPAAYDFLQLVRLLERFTVLQCGRRMLGHWLPPADEGIRFRCEIGLGFSPESIARVSPPVGEAGEARPWQLATSVLSIAGASGVLPYPYAEWLQASVKNRDCAFLEFLERFHHRTLSLYYRALVKYRLPVAYEKASLVKSSPKNTSAITVCPTGVMQALIGRFRRGPDNPTQIYFSAFYAQTSRSASTLEKILGFYFAVPVRVVDFIGAWQALDTGTRSRLGRSRATCPANNRLGNTALLGKRAWLSQQVVRIELGPLREADLRMFSAGGDARAALDKLSRDFLGEFCDIEVNLVVARRHLSNRARLAGRVGPRLGWDTVLASRHGMQTRAGALCQLSFKDT